VSISGPIDTDHRHTLALLDVLVARALALHGRRRRRTRRISIRDILGRSTARSFRARRRRGAGCFRFARLLWLWRDDGGGLILEVESFVEIALIVLWREVAATRGALLPLARMALVEMIAAHRVAAVIARAAIQGVAEHDVLVLVVADPVIAALGARHELALAAAQAALHVRRTSAHVVVSKLLSGESRKIIVFSFKSNVIEVRINMNAIVKCVE